MGDASDVRRVSDVVDFFGVELADVVATVVPYFEPPGAILESGIKKGDLTLIHWRQTLETAPMLRLKYLASL